ncbi:hypothetical protein DUI87_16572 [Hirundo rustica rustica]|uniref:General transcription factor IIF subunit 2 n=1 Tax=Hirundo rustica rustica TaxID=333673 RepID=A0A3M0K1W5_HIRRU|nr:hypothetical protein DUI87_16572 [Hirundo rustica rustica]
MSFASFLLTFIAENDTIWPTPDVHQLLFHIGLCDNIPPGNPVEGRLQIEESSKPVRLSQQLDKAVTTNYKPVANHQYNIEYEKKKKEDGKRARADKQQVLDMLFSAFEKHQYYNIKDLVDITKQPVIYLKEILREIGIYNVKGTHKNTWELKPEYRHYQGEEKSD